MPRVLSAECDALRTGVLDLRQLLLPKSKLRIAGTEGKDGIGQRTVPCGMRGDANENCAVRTPLEAAAARIDDGFIR